MREQVAHPAAGEGRGGLGRTPSPLCGCGVSRALIAWAACGCRADTRGPGHRAWECRGCGRRTFLGCLGFHWQGSKESYGCRTGDCARRATQLIR